MLELGMGGVGDAGFGDSKIGVCLDLPALMQSRLLLRRRAS